MRQKIHTYNFLRSGCSFCYRDIFSGLSNENLGTALYFCIAPSPPAPFTKFTAMKRLKHHSISAIAYYQPLLQRHAMRLINNKAAAEKITKEVLNDQYDLDKQEPSPQLQKVLLTEMRNRCFYYNQSKIFDRPLIKVPANLLFL
jgi:hypothetical protein